MLDANSVWKDTATEIIEYGNKVSPRGFNTLEILGKQTHVNMDKSVVTIADRKLSQKFLFGEAWWILSGSNRLSDIEPYMLSIGQFSDNERTFRGAYGPQVIEQLDYVIESLETDTDSRQAVLTIWRQNPRPSKDIPCTVAIQWFIRGDKLYCSTTMRSSDFYLGWMYDIFNFSCISMYILIALRNSRYTRAYQNLELGNLILTAGSQHLYERNFDAVSDCLTCDETVDFDYSLFNPRLYSHPEAFVGELKRRAEDARKQK